MTWQIVQKYRSIGPGMSTVESQVVRTMLSVLMKMKVKSVLAFKIHINTSKFQKLDFFVGRGPCLNSSYLEDTSLLTCLL